MFLKHFLNHFNHRSIRILPKIFKPVFIILLIIGVFFLAKTNFAQTTSSSTSSSNNDWTKYSLIKQKQDAIKKGNNQESLVFESISTDIVTFITALVGEVPDSVLQGKNTSWTPSGMIGQANKLISFTFYQPVSGIQYISQIKDNFLSKDVKGKLIPKNIFGELKVLGQVEAGFPSPAEEETADTMSMDEYLIKNKEATYMLKVSGDSMKDAGIMNGDMVLVDRSLTPVDGDIVIAEVDNQWTIKYLRKNGNNIFLEPANKKFSNIYPKEELKIAAVVKAVVRRY